MSNIKLAKRLMATSERASTRQPETAKDRGIAAIRRIAKGMQAGGLDESRTLPGIMEKRRTLDHWMNMQPMRPSPNQYARMVGKDNVALVHFSMYLEGMSEEFHREAFGYVSDDLYRHNPLRRRTLSRKTRLDRELAFALVDRLSNKMVRMDISSRIPANAAAELIDRYSRVLPRDIVYYGRPGTRKILETTSAKPINCIFIVKMENDVTAALARIDGTILYPITHQGDIAPPQNMRVVGSFSEG